MIFNMVCGGSGIAALNFKIVGGTTQPDSPRVNTLWVNTDLEFDTWTLNVSEPTNPKMNDIWIKLGVSSPVAFDISCDDYAHIVLRPVAIYQWTGSWTNLTNSSMLWDGDKWIYFNTYLFKDGNQYNEITGGWKQRIDNGAWTNINLSMNNIYVFANEKRDYGISVYAQTENLIDVTNYNELSIMLEEYNETFELSLVDGSENKIAQTTLPYYPNNTGVITLNLVNVTGSYYIRLSSSSGDHGLEGDSYANTHFIISEVKLLSINN